LTCETFWIYAIVAAQQLFNMLRITDIGLLAEYRQWTVKEYWEYYFTFYTDAMRRQLLKAGKPIGSPLLVMPQDRTPKYYGRVAYRLFVEYVIYTLLRWYALHYPPSAPVEFDGKLVNLWNLSAIMDQLIAGLTLYVLISMSNTIWFLQMAVILNAPYEPSMASPFLSESIHDFWSKRWNSSIKINLHRLGFKPSMSLLKRLTLKKTEKEHGKWTPPLWHAAFAAFAAFILSGFIHEWLVLALSTKGGPVGENMLFFMLHGILSTTQVMFSKFFHAIGAPLNFPKWISIPFTFCMVLISAPLFLNPWIREDIFSKLKFYTVADFIQLEKTTT
jgi:hypothetical protein